MRTISLQTARRLFIQRQRLNDPRLRERCRRYSRCRARSGLSATRSDQRRGSLTSTGRAEPRGQLRSRRARSTAVARSQPVRILGAQASIVLDRRLSDPRAAHAHLCPRGSHGQSQSALPAVAHRESTTQAPHLARTQAPRPAARARFENKTEEGRGLVFVRLDLGARCIADARLSVDHGQDHGRRSIGHSEVVGLERALPARLDTAREVV